ncbi:MAG: hypothetical protein AAFQ89_12165, partial [Cyanobacteria bacterium J06626_18]
ITGIVALPLQPEMCVRRSPLPATYYPLLPPTPSLPALLMLAITNFVGFGDLNAERNVSQILNGEL